MRRLSFAFISIASLVMIVALAACASSTPAPKVYDATKTNETSVLNNRFEMAIPDGLTSEGVEKQYDCDSQWFKASNDPSNARIFIMGSTIQYLNPDDFVADYFKSPPKDATYTYEDTKISTLSNGHIISYTDVYEKNAKESHQREICFACDNNYIVNITLEHFDEGYMKKAVTSIKF